MGGLLLLKAIFFPSLLFIVNKGRGHGQANESRTKLVYFTTSEQIVTFPGASRFKIAIRRQEL